MERVLPQTSLDAYKSITSDIFSNQHKQIIEALSYLGKATYDDIANHLTWDEGKFVQQGE